MSAAAPNHLNNDIDWAQVLASLPSYCHPLSISGDTLTVACDPPSGPPAGMAVGPGGGNEGSQTPAKNGEGKKNLFQCASEAANKVSLAGLLHHVPGLKSGIGGFAADAVGSNTFSGATDLISSFGSGEAGGHSVYYNMAQGVAAGPSQGFAPAAQALKGTVLEKGPVDALIEATPFVGEYATGIGEAKFVYDGATYLGATAGCAMGWIH